jgi:hypothetical protein
VLGFKAYCVVLAAVVLSGVSSGSNAFAQAFSHFVDLSSKMATMLCTLVGIRKCSCSCRRPLC